MMSTSVANLRYLSIVAAFVAAIGLSFYGGRVYQNNVDQPLFSQYAPPKTTTGGRIGGSSFFGSSTTGGGQVAAALAVATPPGGGAAASATGSTTKGSTTTTQPQGGAKSAAPAVSSTATDISGTLVGAGNGKVTIKTSQGKTQTLAATSATGYFMANPAPASALAVGQLVTVALQPGAAQGFSAGSVTIAPAGTLYGFVKQAQQSTGGLGFSPAGKVSSVSAGTLSLSTSTGRTFSVTLDSSTKVYRLDLVAGNKIAAGTTVSIRQSTSKGAITASNVVASSIPGTVASLTTSTRTRPAGGGLGGGGGFGGGAGAGAGGGAGGAGGGGGNGAGAGGAGN
jgi:hypothetical protein